MKGEMEGWVVEGGDGGGFDGGGGEKTHRQLFCRGEVSRPAGTPLGLPIITDGPSAEFWDIDGIGCLR